MSNFKLTSDDIIISNQLSKIMSPQETQHQLSTQAAKDIKKTINQIELPENLPMKNPNKKIEELLQNEITQRDDTNRQLMKTLGEIEAKNTKLNEQIGTLNKTIEEQKKELDEMIEAKKKSDEGYWTKTIIISVGCAILGFILDHLIF